MIETPPDGSSLTVDSWRGSERLTVPQEGNKLRRYLLGVAFLVFLLGWSWTLFQSFAVGGLGLMGLIFLGAAGFMVFAVYRLLRPTVPERLILSYPTLRLDSGVPPLRMEGHGDNVRWHNLWPKRRYIEFDASEIESLALHQHAESNRLTIDKGAERVPLARYATDVEREWLYDQIKAKYGL